VIAFNDAHKDQEMPYFGQEILTMAEKKGPLTDPKYKAALAAKPSEGASCWASTLR
jgi:amidase